MFSSHLFLRLHGAVLYLAKEAAKKELRHDGMAELHLHLVVSRLSVTVFVVVCLSSYFYHASSFFSFVCILWFQINMA